MCYYGVSLYLDMDDVDADFEVVESHGQVFKLADDVVNEAFAPTSVSQRQPRLVLVLNAKRRGDDGCV